MYIYINTGGNWENEQLCGNTTSGGRSVFAQFRVFPISTKGGGGGGGGDWRLKSLINLGDIIFVFGHVHDLASKH